jgi:hypothetical protein
VIPFTSGVVLAAIPQSEEDLEFGREDLRAGCATGIYEEVSTEEVREVVRTGRIVSSAFTVWQGEGAERKGRFVINFAQQCRHWQKAGQDGNVAGIRAGTGQERCANELGREVGIPTLQPCCLFPKVGIL